MKDLILLTLFLLLLGSSKAQFSQPGDIDTTFNFGFPNSFFTNPNNPRPGTGTTTLSTLALQADGKVLIGGSFGYYNGKSRNGIARLNADGSLDSSFDPGTGLKNGVNPGSVQSIAIQQDGKVLIGGTFTSYNFTPRSNIARLNADGSLDATFNPGTGANGAVYSCAIQPDGKVMIGGTFTSYNTTSRNRIARLNGDGSLDASFNPGSGTDNDIRSFAFQFGKILIGGQFTSFNGTPCGRIARLNSDGSLDGTFNPGTGSNNPVYSLTLQPDGKILVGGSISSYNGTARNGIARLDADGTLDPTFNPGTGGGGSFWYVNSVALQPEGKILIGGYFTSYNSTSRNRIARLNENGSLDATFNPGKGAEATSSFTNIGSLALQPNGKVLIGGLFTSYDGVACNYIARLSPEGSLDATFNPGTGSNGPIASLALQPDAKVLIGGNFTSCNNKPRNRIARLNVDGTLDETFNPGAGANNQVLSFAIQPDNKVLIVGAFTTYNGTSRNGIARLNADGSLDATFNPGTGAGGSSQIIYSCAIQSDGKVVVGGLFTNYNGTPQNNIARLNVDGSLDATFNPGTGTNFGIYSIALQPDGKVLIGGGFTSYNGTSRNQIARLNTDGSLDETFTMGNGPNGLVQRLVIQPDGKVIIVGNFTSFNFTSRNGIARINPNGGLDASFSPGTGASGGIQSLALQSDGKILIGGGFGSYNGTFRNKIARLNSDGSLDITFDPGSGIDGVGTPTVQAITIQPDGKLLVGGEFATYDFDFYRSRIVRVLSSNCDLIATNTTSPSSVCVGGTKDLIGSAGGNWILSGPGSINGNTYGATGGAGTVSIYNQVGGCTSPSVTFTVNPLPATNAGADFSAIQNTGNVTLTPNPTGGTWSGTGVNASGVFDVSQAVGFYPLIYCYTNSQGCSKCDTVVATISPQAVTSIDKPVITPTAGTFADPVSVSITCATLGVTIYYTTTGNLPVVGTGFTKVYSGPFQLIQSATVRAMAVINGLPNSAISASFITITNPGIAANPIISPGTGSYSGSQTVTISTATSGASIYYATGGYMPVLDKPTSFTKLYSGPFTLNASTTIRAIATKAGIENSSVSLANINITNPTPYVSTPVISPVSGIYSGTQTVSVSCATPGATIYYTTSGNTPVIGTGFTKLYLGSFSVSSSATVRAMATAPGFLNSGVGVSFITIGAGRVAVDNFEEELAESEFIQVLKAFPNPTTGFINLVTSEPIENVRVELFNSVGQLVFKKESDKLENESISIHSLPVGIYNLKVTAQDYTRDIRIVKQ